MALTIKVAESNGAGPAVTAYTPTSPATHQWSYKCADTPGVAVAGEEVPREGLRSYAKWFRLEASGTGTSVNGIIGWWSDPNLTLYGTGAKITASLQLTAAYSQSVNNDDTMDSTAPTSYATGLDLTPAGGITSFTGYSEYARHQLTVGADATPGVYTDTCKFNLYYVAV